MDQEPVAHLQSALGQVLVSAVDGVARLEGDDGRPAPLAEGVAGGGGRQAVLGELLARLVLGRDSDDLDWPGHEPLALLGDVLDAGMLPVLGSVDAGHLQLLVVRVDLLDVDHGQERPVGMLQRGALAHGEGRLDLVQFRLSKFKVDQRPLMS